MTTLIVGDVHGCADELSSLVALARPDQVVLVGDLFTKGPDPAGVWAQIRQGGYTAVLGNHDLRLLEVLGGNRPDDAHGHATVAILDAADDRWRAYVAALPLTRRVGPLIVVHAALHPSGNLAATTRRIATRLRRWPSDAIDDPPWWTQYAGPCPVVFGHDARQGFVRRDRDGAPYVVGLDTGCVYGGALTGWLVEEARPVQVCAQRNHCPIR